MSCGKPKTLRDALLPAVDVMRGIPGLLGQRLFTVSVVVRSWDGSRQGIGSNTDGSTNVRVDMGQFQVKVRQVTEKDIIASGGLYTDQDLKVGPITPPYPGGKANNSDISIFDPAVGTNPTEVFFNVKGPGHPVEGSWYKKIGQDVTPVFHYEFTVRKTAEIP